MEGRGTDAVALQGFAGQDYAFFVPPTEGALTIGQTFEVQAWVERADAILALGVKARQMHGSGRIGLARGQLGEAVDGSIAVRHHHAIEAHGRIAGVGVHAGIDGEPITMLLELGHPHCQLGKCIVRLLEQVPFDAHVPEECHRHAQFLTGLTTSGVRGAGTHMLAHHGRRHKQ